MDSTRRIVIFLVLFSAVIALYRSCENTFQSKNEALINVQKEEKEEAKKVTFKEADPRCKLVLKGENPLPFDHYITLNLVTDAALSLKGAKATLVGTKNGAVDPARDSFDLMKKALVISYSEDKLAGVYAKAVEIVDAKGEPICKTNSIRYSLPVLPSCEIRSDKTKYLRGEKMFICFYDSANLKKPIYDIELFGTFTNEKGVKVDDLSMALSQKQIEDRRFYEQRVLDLIALPPKLKDGRGKICWSFDISKSAAIGKFHRYVYGLDGSKNEDRICRSNDIFLEIAAK